MTRIELLRIRDAVHEARDYLDGLHGRAVAINGPDHRSVYAIAYKASRLRWVCLELDREIDRPPELFTP